MVRCGAGAGLNIEVCGAVRAPALDDGAVRCGCGPLHCGVVRSRAKLLGPRRALVGGSRSPRSGLVRVGLRKRGHFSKVGLGLVCVQSFRITAGFVWVFSGYHYSAGGDSVAPDLVSPGVICLGGSCLAGA